MIFNNYPYESNEFIGGAEERLERFCEMLSKKSDFGKKIDLDYEKTYVSFDNHTNIVIGRKAKDKGEFADISIYGFCKETKKNILIAIEAKYLTNWSVEKDVKKNQKRLKEIKESPQFKDTEIIFCLLINDSKYENQKKRKDSELKKLEDIITGVNKDHLEKPIFLTWREDLLSLCENSKKSNAKKIDAEKKVVEYMNIQLEKKGTDK